MKVLFKNQTVELNEEPYHIGDTIDDFLLVDKDLNTIKSNDLKGMKLFLTIPSVDTSVCSLELSKFMKAIQSKEVTCVSVSMDLPFALNRWCQANLASDKIRVTSDFRYRDFSKIPGVFMPEIGLFARSVMVVDENNQVVYIEVCENVSSEPNYEEALKWI